MTIKKVPLTQANALLSADYRIYRHTETDEIIIRTTGYALPAALHDHVETIAPTTYFGSPRALRLNSKVVSKGQKIFSDGLEIQDVPATFVPGPQIPSNCSDTITPTCLRLLYKTVNYKPRATSKNKLGVTGYMGQYASHSDLTKFLTRYRIDAASANFSVVTVNGGINNQSKPGSEVRVVLHVRANVDVICHHTGQP